MLLLPMLKELETSEKNKESVLILANPAELQKITIEALTLYAKKKKLPGVYISLTKPTRLFQEELKKEKIPIGKIIFMESTIDKSNKYSNVVFIPTIEDLTGILIALESFFSSGNQEKFLIIDSIDVLGVHNDKDPVLDFLLKIVHKCADNNTNCLTFMAKKIHEKLIQKVKPIFDRVLYSE
jgi:archaellum biogenesis ATPase FlaH